MLGYPDRLSISEAEFSGHLLHHVCERLVRGCLPLGRADLLQVVVDGQIRKSPGELQDAGAAAGW